MKPLEFSIPTAPSASRLAALWLMLVPLLALLPAAGHATPIPDGAAMVNRLPQIETTATGCGDDDDDDNGKGKGKPPTDKPAIKDRQVVEPPGKGKSNSQASQQVKTLVEKFQQARDKHLEEQRVLRLQMKDATEEQRAAIRAQLQESLNRLKEQHKQFQEEAKQRAQEMKQNLNDTLDRVIDRGVGEDKGRGR